MNYKPMIYTKDTQCRACWQVLTPWIYDEEITYCVDTKQGVKRINQRDNSANVPDMQALVTMHGDPYAMLYHCVRCGFEWEENLPEGDG